MGAIPKHKTSVVDEKWDGPANEKKLKTDQDYSYYAKMYAWVDPEGDKSTKSAYKFPHHMVSDDGNPGAANVKALQSGIGVLNGAMGGADIPNSDRKGVYNHLASHLKDADIEPPELKSERSDARREFRTFEFELRKTGEEDNKTKIIGYSAVFDQLSEDLGGFREKIARGAFAKSIKEDDIRVLFNHDPNYVLGRNRNGTLKLTEDDHGLKVEIDPPDTQFANDLVKQIDRGDINQMSIGFVTRKDEWDETDKNNPVRTLLDVQLWDVSPVTYPAFPQTSVGVRSTEEVYREYCAGKVEPKIEFKDDKPKEYNKIAKLKLRIFEALNKN